MPCIMPARPAPLTRLPAPPARPQELVGPSLTLEYVERCWANDDRWEAVAEEVRRGGGGSGVSGECDVLVVRDGHMQKGIVGRSTGR